MFDYMYNSYSSLLLCVPPHHHYEPLEAHCIVKRYLINKKKDHKDGIHELFSFIRRTGVYG